MAKMSQSGEACDRAAMAAYQSFLDRSDKALEHNDFDAFVSQVLLPHTLRYGADDLIVTSTEEVRQVFDATRHMLSTRNILRRTRLCTGARVTDDGTLIGHHTTWLVTTANTIDESYRVETHLQQSNGVWCVVATKHDGPANTLPARVHQAQLAAQRISEVQLPDGEDTHD